LIQKIFAVILHTYTGKEAAQPQQHKDESMYGERNASPLQCTYADFNRARGYASIQDLAKQQHQASRLFMLVDGGMKLPSLSKSIQASPLLDGFVATELEMYRNPDTRQFGENIFSVVGTDAAYRLGHLERYCGPTFRMSIKEFKAKSGGNIAAVVQRQISVMEYDAAFVTARKMGGRATKWRVSRR